MTQEKQTSIRILQSKPTKKTLGQSTIFLLGLLTGVIIASIFFLAFMQINSTKNLNTTAITDPSSKIQQSNESRDEENSASHHDESSVAYKQHMDDKDFNKMFKHENKSTEQKNPSGSPFEQIIKPEVKQLPPTIHKPQSTTIKPTTNQVKPKPEANIKVAAKEIKPEPKEISPEGSVKMSIEKKVVEDKP